LLKTVITRLMKLLTRRGVLVEDMGQTYVAEPDMDGDQARTLRPLQAAAGIGAVPEETLAREAGLDCANGIVVDAFMRTSDSAILANGDCTSFPEPGSGRRLRPESVQNANDQARTAAATLQGREAPYAALPWFWSEQGGVRPQMAGLMPAAARATAALARPLRASRSCTTWENAWPASKASTRLPCGRASCSRPAKSRRRPRPATRRRR
jgi:NADPH-dependent 2,4-dienoyl-CoA reductase/sulfur reductase-like enzyme